MKITDNTVDVCLSSLQGCKFDHSDLSTDFILDVNRYKKYIRLYLLDMYMGDVSKKDASSLLNIIKSMNKYVRVNK